MLIFDPSFVSKLKLYLPNKIRVACLSLFIVCFSSLMFTSNACLIILILTFQTQTRYNKDYHFLELSSFLQSLCQYHLLLPVLLIKYWHKLYHLNLGFYLLFQASKNHFFRLNLMSCLRERHMGN